MPIRVAAQIYFVLFQEVRNPQAPTKNPKFARTPGRTNRKIVNYKTKTGEALYKLATRSLYLDSEVLLTFVGLLTGHTKSCVWDIYRQLTL